MFLELHKCLLANDKENKHTSFIAGMLIYIYSNDTLS